MGARQSRTAGITTIAALLVFWSIVVVFGRPIGDYGVETDFWLSWHECG